MSYKVNKGVDNNNQRGVNFADPSANTDAATKQYVDNVANGRDWKESVRGASTGNLAVATALVNGLVHDGVTYATGDSILLKNQTTASENGPWIIVASGAASRRNDFDTSAKATPGATFTAEEGTLNGDKRFVLTTNAPIVLGTTALVFTVDAAGGSTYVAGSGLAESPAGTFNVGVTAGLTVAADTVGIDTAVVARKFAADCVATTNPQNFDHGMGTDVIVQVWEGNNLVQPDVSKSATSGGRATVDWGGAPTVAQYRVVVHA